MDFGLVKVDSIGQLEWNEYYDGFVEVMSRNDNPYAMRQMPDSGYVLVGTGNGGGYPMVVRTDTTGGVRWMQIYEPDNGEIYSPEDCVIDNDGNIIVVGYTGLVTKLSDEQEGEVLWSLNANDDGQLWGAAKPSDGGVLAVGILRGDAFAIRISSQGDPEWENTYGTEGYSLSADGAIQLTDGGYCLVGGARFGRFDSSYASITRISSNGELVWQRVYNEFEMADYFSAVVETYDGGLAAAGSSEDGYLLYRTDSVGEVIWRVTYGRSHENCRAIILMPDNGFLLGGEGRDGIKLIRTEQDPLPPSPFSLLEPGDGDSINLGEVRFVWQQSVDPNPTDTVSYAFWLKNGEDSVSYSDIQDTSVFIGLDSVFANWDDPVIVEWWITAISNEDSIESREHLRLLVIPQGVGFSPGPLTTDFTFGQIFPNPFNSTSTIAYSLPASSAVSLRVFDLNGRLVESLVETRQEAGYHKATWMAGDVPAGLYLCRLEVGDFRQTAKLLLVR